MPTVVKHGILRSVRSVSTYVGIVQSATSNNMKLVDWPLIGGLLHLVQRGQDRAGPQPAFRPLTAVQNVTAHPSTASVPTSYYSIWRHGRPKSGIHQAVEEKFANLNCLSVYVREIRIRSIDATIRSNEWLYTKMVRKYCGGDVILSPSRFQHWGGDAYQCPTYTARWSRSTWPGGSRTRCWVNGRVRGRPVVEHCLSVVTPSAETIREDSDDDEMQLAASSAVHSAVRLAL